MTLKKVPQQLFSQHRHCGIGFIKRICDDKENKKLQHSFWAKDTSNNMFIGLDNRTGKAFLEQFVDPEDLLKWFNS